MKQSQDPPRLFPRERQVLVMIANGDRAHAIAQILNIRQCTIEATVKRVLHRLGAVNRAHAVAVALKLGEITLDDIQDPRACP